MTPLFKKLNLGSNTSILVISAPESFEAELKQLEGIKITRKGASKKAVGFAIGFAITQSELDHLSTVLVKSTMSDGVVWVAYPKGTSKRYTCEFNRDQGWSVLGSEGYEPVRQVAIDEDWSALRFRKVDHIKTMTRRSEMTISNEGKRRTQK